MNKLSDIIERKFIDIIEFEPGWEIETDSGFKPITHINKTIKYEKWILTTEDHILECADTHIVFDENYNEVFVKDLRRGDKILTKYSSEKVISIENTHNMVNMYDITVNDCNHRYYTNDILSHNTTSYVCFIVWLSVFHKDTAIAVLANKGATSRQIIQRVELAIMYLPKWICPGIVSFNKGSYEFDNGSSVISGSTTSDSIRGSSFKCLIVDELGFIPSNIFAEFWKSVYPTISSGKETRVIGVSTFNGQNHFYDMWVEAEAGKSNFVPTRVDWWDVPGRDENWKNEQLKAMSEEDFAQEFGNEALGSGLSLLSSKGFSMIEKTVQQPLQFTLDSKIYEEPIKGHRYIVSCDCASDGLDYSAFSVIDITQFPYKQVATFRNNKISHLQYPTIITQFAYKYNNADVLVENNEVGKTILHILNYELEYENLISMKIGPKIQLGVRTTTKSKSVGCARLKDMIERGQLLILDKYTQTEFKHFSIKGSSYEAESGYHDDTVMCLVIFAYYASTSNFKMKYDRNFFDEMKDIYEKEAEESLTPLPMFGYDVRHQDNDIPDGFLDF